MSSLIVGLLAAALAADIDPILVNARLGTGQSGGSRLVVSIEYPQGSTIDLSPPVAQGLTFKKIEPVYTETVDARVIEVHEYRFTGSAGSYELLPLTVDWENEGVRGSASSYSLFIDHEIDKQSPSEMVDIVEPNVTKGTSWLVVLTGMGLLGLVGAGMYTAFRNRQDEDTESEEKVLPPHEIALTRWQAVLDDEVLGVDDKAIELSALFREYLEAQLHFPATAWTTTQSMQHLGELVHLDPKHLKSAKRILRATDWVKYAEVSTHDEALRALDSDLRGFIEATKPHYWESDS